VGNRRKQTEGSFVRIFSTAKGKVVITVRQFDGSEVNMHHMILTPEDLAYLESISVQVTL